MTSIGLSHFGGNQTIFMMKEPAICFALLSLAVGLSRYKSLDLRMVNEFARCRGVRSLE